MLTLPTYTLPAHTGGGGEQKFSLPALFALLILLIVSCTGQPEKQKETGNEVVVQSATLPNHVKYSFSKHNEKARKPKEGDLLTFKLRIQNSQNVELSNATYKEHPYEENYFIFKPFFKEVFAIAGEGDVMNFWIHADSLKGKQGDLQTNKIPAGTLIKYSLEMIQIRSKEEIKRELKEKYSKRYTKDSTEIALYIQELKKKEARLELQITESGLHYYIRKPGKGRPPQEGDTVTVNYVEKSLDGRLVNPINAPTEFVVGSILPKGLNEGISLMTEGASSVFILPTKLGHDEDIEDADIPKNIILVYEIDMLKMKH